MEGPSRLSLKTEVTITDLKNETGKRWEFSTFMGYLIKSWYFGACIGSFLTYFISLKCKRKCSTFMGHLMELSPVWLTASLKCMGSLFAVFRVQQNPENGFQNSTIFQEKN